PAVLIEYAFITNKQDEKILINQVDDLARWTSAGVSDYFRCAPSENEKKPKNQKAAMVIQIKLKKYKSGSVQNRMVKQERILGNVLLKSYSLNYINNLIKI